MYKCRVRIKGTIIEECYFLEDWTDACSKFATDLALMDGSYKMVIDVENQINGFKKTYDLIHRVD